MFLTNIKIKAFRNIENAEIKFCNKFNIFYGNNGHGKTNLLEAIFYLGTVKSFRHAKNRDMISWDQPAAALKCTITDNGLVHELSVTFDDHGRQLKIDNKNITKIIDYCNTFSVVAFSPDELAMVVGTPEQRRRYLDRAIFSSSPGYLTLYHNYFRALKQRNQLLKDRNYVGIEAWTEQVASVGGKLINVRNKYVKELGELFSKYYRDISNSDEEGRVCYYTNSLSKDTDPADVSNELLKALAENSRLERERCMTLKGPHRDDLLFILNNKPIKEHGSQGQQKSFVLALKMAEIEHLEQTSGRLPILLLDDMTAELDKIRIGHLMQYLIDRKMQVFITTTDHDTVPFSRGSEFSIFNIENGRLV